MSDTSPTPRDALAAAPAVLSDEAASGVDPDASPVVASPRVVVPAPPGIEPALAQYAKDNRVDPAQLKKQESLYRRLLTQLGFAPTGPAIAPAFQLQYTWDRNNASFFGKRINFNAASTVGRYFTLELDRIQFNTKLEFNSQTEYITSTARFDTRTKIVQQLNFEFRPRGYKSAKPADGIMWDGIKVIANLDALPRPPGADPNNLRRLAGIPGLRGYQFGVALTGSIYGVKAVYEDLVVVDFSALFPDPKKLAQGNTRVDFTRFVSLGNNLQITVPLDVMPGIEDIAKKVGGKWSVTAKVFMRVYATAEQWARAAGVLVETARKAASGVAATARNVLAGGQSAAGEALAATGEAEALVTVTPSLAIAGSLAAAGIAVTVAGLLAIRDRLESGRDSAILNSYISGYADELAGAVANPSAWLLAEIQKFALYDFRAALEEISAYVHGRKPTQPYRLPALEPGALSFALALNQGATELGRASAIVAIYSLMQTDGVAAWLRIRSLQQNHLAARRAAGEAISLKPFYVAELTRRATNTTVGLPLKMLDQIL